ncbi:uncharacterized protein [Pempheris klunzingeri]|uniref:uncharacterized protein n=1 Tax=Pempheris klunzingeri TaxID=3127111 RepID=UPI00397EF59D
MEDGVRAAEEAEVSRRELYEDYWERHLLPCAEARPCRDPRLLKKAARYLAEEPRPAGTFTVFPFDQLVAEGRGGPGTDYRKHLAAFIRASELLETLCINLFLQPWRREIKTLKTFTGPFVYCLLPVLSSSTIQSVLASIGYLPHTDTPPSEYRLSEDADPDRAILVGFELLLARVECYYLLELLGEDQLGPQEWLEVLQRRVGPAKLEELTVKKTPSGQKEVEKRKKEEADRQEVPLCLDTRPAVNTQSKPQHCHLISSDQSIMEMQMTYPDLAFRGRLLLPDKPYQANTRRSRGKAAHTASADSNSVDSKATDLPNRDCTKGTKAPATATIHNRNDGSKADEVFEDGRSSGRDDRNRGGTTATGDAISSSFSNTDGGAVNNELSHPQAISLHITLRAGATADQHVKPGQPQPTAAPPAWTQKQTAAGLPSLSSMDDEQDLRDLAERMGQLDLQETKEEVKTKEENKRGEDKTNKEGRKNVKKASTEGGAEEQNPRRPQVERGPAQSHAARRCSRSSQSDSLKVKEQKQPSVCHPSPLTYSTADCQNCEGEHSKRAETGRGEEEQLAQGFVIVEHH